MEVTEAQKKLFIDVMITKTAEAMRKQLLLPRNMNKSLWFTMSNEEILMRCYQELDELKEIVHTYIYNDKALPGRNKMDREWKHRKIVEEAADVCNFLGFLIDNQGGRI